MTRQSKYLEPAGPRVFGHRGACGQAPENTLPSFSLAAALGAGYLELDVHGTSDGTIVVLHDPLLDRTTNGSGPVNELRWSEVERLDAGYRFSADGSSFPYRGNGVRIPTLESVLRAFPDQRFNIEIKQEEPAIVDDAVALLHKVGCADRTLLAAEHGSIMNEIRRAVGDSIVTGYSTDDVLGFFEHFEAGTLAQYEPPGVALQVPTEAFGNPIVTAESVRAAHESGLEVHVWTINERSEVDRLLDLGVDAVMSDFPGLVTEAIRARSAAR